MTQHRLGDYGAGNDRTTAGLDEDGGDGWSTDDQCIAVSASTGERCENRISRMTDTDLCSAHDRAADVETVEDGGPE